MKFILLTIIGMVSFVTIAQTSDIPHQSEAYSVDTKKCSGEEDKYIKELESELDNCIVKMPDEPTNEDMDRAYYHMADCAIEVGNKTFDRYYTKHNKHARENFDNLVKAIYACSHDLNQHSDYGSENYIGIMHNTQAIAGAGFWIKDVVKMYLNKTRQECNDKTDD